jgi:glutathione S-transferase
MKLYYSAGSCSTCCHIALEEAGLKHEVVAIDWDQTADPNLKLIEKLNPLGTLPVATLDNGKVLSQNIAILTYIADQSPEKKLLPPPGTVERAEAMNWLSFVASDLHKSVGGLFATQSFSTDPAKQADYRTWGLVNANRTLAYLDHGLAGKDYLMGSQFTVADAYAFIVAGWTKWLDIPLTNYPNIRSFVNRVLERPAVQKVFKLEGLFDE